MTIADTAAQDARPRPEDADEQERPPRVLVVDDEPSLADLLTLAFQYEGWDVRTAGNGAEALRLAAEFRPDAVLLDMMLPDIDGLEVVRRLRAEASDVPVLFLSARDDIEDRTAGLDAGAQGYLTKPFSLDDVIGGVRALMAPEESALMAPE